MDRKKEIIETSATLFKEKGYAAVTMREIAKTIGIKAASLYNHIKSKQEILTIMALGVAESFTNGMKVINTSDVGTIDKLKEIITLYINITLQNPEVMESLENDWIYLEGDSLENYRKLRQGFENNLRNILIEGIKSGDLKDSNPEIALYFLLYTLRSVNKWYPYQDGIDKELLKTELFSLVMQGMMKKKQTVITDRFP